MSYSHDDDNPQPGGTDAPKPAPAAQVPSWRAGEDQEQFEMPKAGQPEAGGPGLSERLRGYDPAPVDAEHVRETRRCPACNIVGQFVDGRCLNCGFKIGGSDPAAVMEAEELRFAADATGGDTSKWVAGGLIVVLLIVVGVFVLPMLKGNKEQPVEDTAAAPAVPKGTPVGKGTKPSQVAGSLDEIKVDDAFYKDLDNELIVSNSAWSSAGVKAYAYRYNVLSSIVPATTQTLDLTVYVAGEDVDAAVQAPKDSAFQARMQQWVKAMGNHAGVSATLELRAGEKNNLPTTEDRYIVYGKAWGQDHQKQIDAVIAAINNYKKDGDTKQFPLELSMDLAGGLQTLGNPNFQSDGVGYLPVFKTDAAGNVAMGSGTGLSSFQPQEVTDYYLFFFLHSPTVGLDVMNKDNLKYYNDKISPFPYRPNGPVHNVKLATDGAPDGVGCVVKDGKLI